MVGNTVIHLLTCSNQNVNYNTNYNALVSDWITSKIYQLPLILTALLNVA